VLELKDIVVNHFDPFRTTDMRKLDDVQRREFYAQVRASGTDDIVPAYLDEQELSELMSFLETLTSMTSPSGT
jgi:hypothetical protein